MEPPRALTPNTNIYYTRLSYLIAPGRLTLLVFAQATDLSFDSGLSKAAQPDSTGRALVNPHILAIAKACTGAGVFPRPKRCLIQRSSVPPTSAAPSSGPVSESLSPSARVNVTEAVRSQPFPSPWRPIAPDVDDPRGGEC